MSERTVKHRSILWGLVLGVVLGLIAHAYVESPPVALAVAVAKVVGKLFLRLMQMVVLPLVVSALYLAVVELGDLKRLGRLGLRTLAFTGLLSFSAVLIGVMLVNVFQPGRSISAENRAALLERYSKGAAENQAKAAAAKSIDRTLVDLLPENPVQEMVGAVDGSSKGNGMLAVMVFALLCGIAATSIPTETATLTGVMRGLNGLAMTIIGWALQIAPVGAGCLVFVVAAELGFDILRSLAAFVATTLAGLALHLFGIYSLVLLVFARRSPWQFFRDVTNPMLVAFSTSSSSATLSTSLKSAQDDLKLRPQTANFVLTVGATGNQNGTALFEGVVVLFLAQVFGVSLTLGQQFAVVLMSILAGVGTAGVPGGSIPLIVVVLKSVGVPEDGIALVLGVDRLLDMCRTVVNVVGDLVVATCVDADPQIKTGESVGTSDGGGVPGPVS